LNGAKVVNLASKQKAVDNNKDAVLRESMALNAKIERSVEQQLERISPVSFDDDIPTSNHRGAARGGVHGKRNPRGAATVPKQFRLYPSLAEALERAAAAEGVSTSRFLNDLLENDPNIAEHFTP
jgi:hypothetical protein